MDRLYDLPILLLTKDYRKIVGTLTLKYEEYDRTVIPTQFLGVYLLLIMRGYKRASM